MNHDLLFMTVPEVAAALRTSEQAVRRLIRQGRLRAGRPGARYLVDPAAVRELVTAAASANMNANKHP